MPPVRTAGMQAKRLHFRGTRGTSAPQEVELSADRPDASGRSAILASAARALHFQNAEAADLNSSGRFPSTHTR